MNARFASARFAVRNAARIDTARIDDRSSARSGSPKACATIALRSSLAIVLSVAAMALLSPRPALAHAALVRSYPAANATVSGSDLNLQLVYNSRIDASRSTVLLVGPGGQSRKLSFASQNSPQTLSAKLTKLTPGVYKLNWQVLSSDGHVTRGEFSFRVQ